jgi:hypothetical protein
VFQRNMLSPSSGLKSKLRKQRKQPARTKQQADLCLQGCLAFSLTVKTVVVHSYKTQVNSH